MGIRALVAAALFAALSVPVAAERPAEAFATLPRFSNPELSPSGDFIAAQMSFDGKQQLAVIPTDAGLGEATLIDAGDYDLWDIRWVNEDWILVQTGIDGRVSDGRFVEGAEVYISRYVAFRRDGKKQNIIEPRNREMLSNGGTIVWTAEDGSPEILLAYGTSYYSWEPGFWPKVMRVDVSKNRFTLELSAREGIQQYYADSAGVIRVGIGREQSGTKARYIYRSRTGEGFREIASVDYVDDDLLAPTLFLADGKTALTYSGKDGYDALYKLKLEDMSLGERVFGVQKFDIDGYLANRDGNALAGVQWTDTMPRVQWFEPALQEAQSLMDRTFPTKLTRIVSVNQANDKFLVAAGNPSEPTSYYFFDAQKKKVSLISGSQELLEKGPNGVVTTVVYTARDGLKVPAILTLPPGREPKNLPFIVLPHGGPQVRDYERWDWWAQFLADRGYGVLQPNYRGSAGFGSAYLELGDGEWGKAMQDDVVDAKKWAVEQGLADADRVCVVGGSYGGYVAMWSAYRDADEFRCSVSFAGVSDMPEMARSDRGGLFGKSFREFWEKRTGDLAEVSPIKHADEFGIPILIVHGKEDTRVPVEQSRDLADKLKQARKTYEYIEQPEGDHFFSRMEDRLGFLLAMEKFLDKYNPAD